MAETENFEDDLFADLYDDNDASAAPPPPAAAAVAAPAVQAPTAHVPTPTPQNVQQSVEEPNHHEIDRAHSEMAYAAEENGYGEEYQDENYEDDDDVDFNLGNGPSGAVTIAQPQQDDSASAYHAARGASAKEDG
ncbi:hypothetical protein F4815DRAFT_291549 [Daldinia loculata]|uniref:uncharacterized protein n=1 Tax=Daldinia loculata TaxID=103429 RepID=UPI0020C3A726|nr:uncharacterized protein F4817DRAFT_295342 [Daldinia loculata]KAI1642446.1 hypothetical protein F4817DRAFT_295342 [Daldinia loculata]KAI2777370.1 hypothetical protein F4815DRAFT_291549 [Daldinia loculata]